MATYASGSIRFNGLGSDNDFETMIQKLVAIEGKQVKQLLSWKNDWQTRLDAFRQIRGELMNLQTTLNGLNSINKFLVKTTTSSDPTKITAVANSDSANVSYNVKVQQKATNAYWTKDIGLHDRADVICNDPAGGTFEYSYKGIYRTVDVPQGTTVEGLIKLINNDSKNPGVKAQMIQTIDGISFQLRGMDTGKTNTLVIRNTANLTGLDVTPANSNYADTQKSARLTAGFSSGADELIPAAGSAETFIYSLDDKRYTVTIQPGDTIQDLVAAINMQTSGLASLTQGADGKYYFELFQPDTVYTFPTNPGYTGTPSTELEGILNKQYDSLDEKVVTADTQVTIGCQSSDSGEIINDVTFTIPAGTTVSGFLSLLQSRVGSRGKVSIQKDAADKYVISLASVDKSHRVTVQNGSYAPLSYTPPTASGWDVVHADNAMVKINDVPSGDKWMEMPSNTLKADEVIPGITFTIIGTTGAEGVDVSVSNDTEKMTENITAFVNAVNSFRTLLTSLTQYDEEKETVDVEYAESQFEMQKGNVLTGNYGIQLVASRLKNAIAGTSLGFLPLSKDSSGFITGGDIFSSLSQIGITTNATQGEANYGLLEINSISGTKGAKSLQECLTEDPEAVARLFAAKGEGRSNSPDYFHYDSHVNTVTKPGNYTVKYSIDANGDIDPATASINGQPCTVSGTTITSADGASKGLAITVVARAKGQSYEGSVSIMDGKINEVLGLLEGTEGMLGTNGTLRTLEKNYQSIIGGIEDKIKREDERLTKFERSMTLRFARLEAVLAKYNGIQESLKTQLAQLNNQNKSS